MFHAHAMMPMSILRFVCVVSQWATPLISCCDLIDTGAHTSFVNRELAAWIEQQAKGDTKYAGRNRGTTGGNNASVLSRNIAN